MKNLHRLSSVFVKDYCQELFIRPPLKPFHTLLEHVVAAMVKAQLRRQRSGRLKYSEEVIGIPGNSKRDLLLADFLLFPTCFGAWVGSTPFPLFQRVILAPVCGRAYSRPATLYFPTHKINGRIAELHLGFSLSVFMPNLSKRQSDKNIRCVSP